MAHKTNAAERHVKKNHVHQVECWYKWGEAQLTQEVEEVWRRRKKNARQHVREPHTEELALPCLELHDLLAVSAHERERECVYVCVCVCVCVCVLALASQFVCVCVCTRAV
jgi:hypothetical protein